MTRDLIAFAVVLAAAGTAHAMPVIQNPGFDSSVTAMGAAPPNWQVGQATPDVVNASGPFNNTGVLWTESSDGGTFVRGNGLEGPQAEAIQQTVSGFTPGAEYELSFEQTNLGFTSNPQATFSGGDGAWQFFIDGNFVAQSDTISRPATKFTPITWSFDSIVFVAPSDSFLLYIISENVTGTFAYMGLDGLGVRLVPAPASAVALLGLAAATRRRRA